MTDIDKIMQKLEFDHRKIHGDHDIDNHSAFSGAKQENTRLLNLIRPILEDWQRMAEALSKAMGGLSITRHHGLSLWPEGKNCIGVCEAADPAYDAVDLALTQHAETVKRLLE